jgi:predicted DNA-binding transcriptional regulator AlpA
MTRVTLVTRPLWPCFRPLNGDWKETAMAKTKKDLDSNRTQNVLTSSLDISSRLLSTEDVARILVVPVSTLYCWRYKGTGPKAYRVGKHLRYRVSDVVEWLEGTR